MIISDLESYITKGGKHAIFTGTFNPPHVGHTEAIRYSFQQLPTLTSVIVIPHSWNKKKNPAAPIGTRAKWVHETLQKFIPDLFSKTVVCFDPEINERPDRYDELCGKYKLKIHRIVGSDKQSVLIRSKDHAEVLLTPRGGLINSTIIRNSVKEGNIDRIRKTIAESVLEDILANQYYSKF